MIFLIIFLVCMFCAVAVVALAGASDVRTMKIPNSFSVYIIAAFVVAYTATYFAGIDGVFSPLWMHALSAVITFAVTFILFALKMIGAGDSKFATACAIWVGARYMPIFLFFMTLTGGLLGVAALYIKKKKPVKNPPKGSWVAQVQGGKDKVPYGVAIGFGMVIAFYYAGYFSPETFSTFLGS